MGELEKKVEYWFKRIREEIPNSGEQISCARIVSSFDESFRKMRNEFPTENFTKEIFSIAGSLLLYQKYVTAVLTWSDKWLFKTKG